MKQIRLLLVIIGICVFMPTALAQDEVSDALLEDIRGIEALTSEIRQLEPLFEVTRVFPSREQVLDLLLADVEARATDEVVEIDVQFYRAFDWLDQNIDLVGATLDLLEDQVAGFYNPETQEMYTLLISGDPLGDQLPILERVTYAHEFVHALQDQHFDLETILQTPPTDNPDQLLAIRALVEGDASAVTNEFLFAVMRDPQIMQQLLQLDLAELLASTQPPEGVPQILFNELVSVYFTGADFIVALQEAGGWEQVNMAYTNLPVSSEQILHPERYLAGDMPIEAVIISPSGADLLENGFELLTERTFGEFYWREYLATQLPDDVVDLAATGWGGDRYQLFYNAETDQRAWVMMLIMDSDQDATEFIEAYRQFAGLRMDTPIELPPEAPECWSSEGEALCIVHIDSTTLSIAYAPSIEQANNMASAQVALMASSSGN